jgi:hypothetical protein
MILTFWANERHEKFDDEATRLADFLKASNIVPPRLVHSTSSDSTSDDSSSRSSSCDFSQGYPLHSPPRVLFGAYWENSRKRHTADENMTDTTAQGPKNTDIDCQRISILTANISRQRRQILPTCSDKNGPSRCCHRMINSCTLESMDSPRDSISLWSHSGMKTYPKSALRKVKQKRRHSKQKQVISFDPDVQIFEYKKEEVHTTGISWTLWFQ